MTVLYGSYSLKKILKLSMLFSLLFCTLFATNVAAVPAAPSGLKAVAEDSQVTLTWNAVPNAANAKYIVASSSSKDGKFKVIARNIPSTSYVHSDLNNSSTYWYKVAVIDKGKSDYSDAVSATPDNIASAPVAPTALIAVAGDEEAILSWEPSGNSAKYTVKRKTSATGSYSIVASDLSDTTFTDTDLTNGLIYYYSVNAQNRVGTSDDSNVARVTPVAPPVTGGVQWPLSKVTSSDGDEIRYPYGPRRPGEYDFHAGIDINAPEGTPVYAVMDGTVTNITPWNGQHGPGNKVLISHGNQHWTGYLHLSAFAPGLTVGQTVNAGDLVGYVGHTGANSDHLHVTYMVGLTSETNNESRSKNPLEIMPHSEPTVNASFLSDPENTVEISIPAQQNTIRWIILKGEGQTRIADYYDIVGKGSTNRNAQTHYGIYIDVDAPEDPYPAGGGTMHLYVSPDPSSPFITDQVIIKDFNGNTLIDKSK